MTFQKLQKQVDDFLRQFKIPYWTPHEQLARIVEEVGELARELNHRFGPKRKKPTETDIEIADEIADIIFTLVALANYQKIDLDEAWERMLRKYNTRDYDRYERAV